MAKITSYPADASPTTDDLVLTVDTTSGSNRKVTVANLATTVLAQATLPTLGWYTPSGTISAVAYNGNRSYSLTTSADQSAVITPGNRLRTTRTIAAPTQCTDLESGSSNYYSKTSPNKTTFTDDFVCSAWIKLESYGAVMSIISRYNGTSGWRFFINTDGTVMLMGHNAGSANYSRVVSYQSVPLGRWVHVAAQLDMSAFTATTVTSYVMMDGLDVPAFVVRAGTNPTALIQAGNLEIGGENGGTSPFDGKLAQVAYYTAKVTQANVKATITQKLSGSETSLASAYSFSNSITDLNTTTPNDLTAQNSAVATSADSPFGGQAGGTISSTLDYAIVQTVSATTLVVQVPEGCTIPVSGGVSAFVYARDKTPFGFPAQQDKWQLSSLLRTDNATTSNASFGAFIAGGFALTVPIGAWKVGWRAGAAYDSVTTAVYFNISSTALTGLSASAGNDASPFQQRLISSAAATFSTSIYVAYSQSLAALSTFIMYTFGATTSAGLSGGSGATEIFAENTLL